MSRRRKSQESLEDELFETLLVAPIWIGPILGVATFVGLFWALPALLGTSSNDGAVSGNFYMILAQISPKLALPLTLGVMGLWVVAEIKKRSRRKRFDGQTGIESIRSLGWREFEALLAEYFRRQEYAVEELGGAGPDGGVDLRLTKAGEVTLVQCKHWKTRTVGVKVARELNGVLASEGARYGILVTSGTFTEEAVAFAHSSPIRLIDGRQLHAIFQSKHVPERPDGMLPVAESQANTPHCPACNALMELRTAQRGQNAGSRFWGCSRFPSCRGTRPFSDRAA